jgi:hypothetical protein
MSAAQNMARRGFVAAVVQYQSAGQYSCGCGGVALWSGVNGLASTPLVCGSPRDGIDEDARAIFDISNADSAIRRLIAVTDTGTTGHGRAILARGVTVFGFSQGSHVARLSETWLRANVKAGYFIGIGSRLRVPTTGDHDPPVPFDVPCQLTDAPAIWGTRMPAAKFRAFMGENDAWFVVPGFAQADRVAEASRQLQALTGSGTRCASGARICEYFSSANGSGWAVAMGQPHGILTSGGNTLRPYGLNVNLNWMAKRTGAPARCIRPDAQGGGFMTCP